jgi:hypothetical protein
MKILRALICAALALSAAEPVYAQNAANAFDAVPIQQLCRKDGSLDLAFGTTEHGVAASHRPGKINRRAGPELAPFAGIAVNATKSSNRMYSAELTAKIGTKVESQAAIARLADRFAAAGWVRSQRELGGDGPLMDLPVDVGDALLYSAAGIEAENDKAGVRLALEYRLGDVVLTCADTGLSRDHVQEVLGVMPPGTPRPRFVAAPPAMSASPADCTDPKKRAAIIESMDEGAMQPDGYDRLDYEERLADWKIMRLVASGKIPRVELTDKIIGLIDEPESQQNMEAALDMLSALEPLAAAGETNDEAGMCKVLLSMKAKGEAASRAVPGAEGEVVTPQWRATHRLLDAEAKRLSVSFDE